MFIRYQMIGTRQAFSGELGIVCDKCLRTVENYFLICLLRRMLPAHNPIIHALTVRLGQLDKPCEQYPPIYNSVESVIGGLPEPMLTPMLEAHLSNLMNELSTKYVDISKMASGKPESLEKLFGDESEPATEAEQTDIPTIKQVKAKHTDKDIPWESFNHTDSQLTEQPLYNLALFARDELLMTAKENFWSKPFSKSWMEKSEQYLLFDTMILFAKSILNKDRIDEVLLDLLKSVGYHTLDQMRLGKTVDELEPLLRELRNNSVLRFDKEIPITPANNNDLFEAIQTGHIEAVYKAIERFIEEKKERIIEILQEDAKRHNFTGEISPLQSTRTYKDNYVKRIFSLVCNPYCQLMGSSHIESLLVGFLMEVLNRKTGRWWSALTNVTEKSRWMLAIPVNNLRIEQSIQLGNVSLYLTDDFKREMENRFGEDITQPKYFSLRSIENKAVWAVASGITVCGQDPELAGDIAKKVISEKLSTLIQVADPQPISTVKLGDENIIARQRDDGKYENPNYRWALGEEFFAKTGVELAGRRNPESSEWGKYLQAIAAKETELAKQVLRATPFLLQAKSHTNPDNKFLDLMRCLQTLTAKSTDGGKKTLWPIRASLLLAGPNVEDAGYKYLAAREWLIGDFKRYLEIQQLLQSGQKIHIDRMNDRLERIVEKAWLTLYGAIEEPEAIDIDDVVLWCSVVYPNQAAIRSEKS